MGASAPKAYDLTKFAKAQFVASAAVAPRDPSVSSQGPSLDTGSRHPPRWIFTWPLLLLSLQPFAGTLHTEGLSWACDALPWRARLSAVSAFEVVGCCIF